jgi:hypothetical protein
MEVRIQGYDATSKIYAPLAIDNSSGGLKTDLDISGLATEASLAALEGKVPDLGSQLKAASMSMTIASDQGDIAVADGAVATLLTSMDGKMQDAGQALSAASAPVVLASDHSTIAVADSTAQGHLSTLAGTVSAGKVAVASTAPAVVGSPGNLVDAGSLAPDATSSSVDVTDVLHGNVLYSDASTASTDGLEIEVSPDDETTWISVYDLFPAVKGSARVAKNLEMSLHGFTHMRLRNVSSTDTYTSVTATVVGQ